MTEREFNRIIGRNIKFFRERCFTNQISKITKRIISKPLTQKQLGRKIDVSFQQVQKYEHGKNKISVYKLLKFCKFFQVPFKYFIDEQTHSKVPYARNLHNAEQQHNI